VTKSFVVDYLKVSAMILPNIAFSIYFFQRQRQENITQSEILFFEFQMESENHKIMINNKT